MKKLQPLLLVAGVVLCSALTQLLAATYDNSICKPGECGGSLSQRCGTNGSSCTYCDGSTTGNWCVWAASGQCTSNGPDQDCGFQHTSTCQDHVCQVTGGGPTVCKMVPCATGS